MEHISISSDEDILGIGFLPDIGVQPVCTLSGSTVWCLPVKILTFSTS